MGHGTLTGRFCFFIMGLISADFDNIPTTIFLYISISQSLTRKFAFYPIFHLKNKNKFLKKNVGIGVGKRNSKPLSNPDLVSLSYLIYAVYIHI